MKNIRLSLYLALLLLVSSCKIADISEVSSLAIPESERIAVNKLQEVIEAQGFNVLQEKNVYQFKAMDHWPGWMGGLAKIWPDKTTNFYTSRPSSLLFANGLLQAL